MDPSLPPRRTGRERLLAVREWIVRGRRTALAQLLRGACYGAGTGAVGLFFLWVEHRM
ncbi:hypothetical protein [Streptomyces pseudovenezuelae]|uniref:hypothetical protein n=1 Tax=Streptomyces pseudovenezuelae TaxID=67350 RepID=UPI002E8210BC|nr:hypothetical protein [Streptomyces pseudovenezuelae]WUA93508.1 hypothetical protein OHO81_41935 [Streptomyces pseudovenezuelae]